MWPLSSKLLACVGAGAVLQQLLVNHTNGTLMAESRRQAAPPILATKQANPTLCDCVRSIRCSQLRNSTTLFKPHVPSSPCCSCNKHQQTLRHVHVLTCENCQVHDNADAVDDAAKLIRVNAHIVTGAVSQVLALASTLPLRLLHSEARWYPDGT